MEKKLYCFTGENKFWCMFAQIKVQTKPIQSWSKGDSIKVLAVLPLFYITLLKQHLMAFLDISFYCQLLYILLIQHL